MNLRNLGRGANSIYIYQPKPKNPTHAVTLSSLWRAISWITVPTSTRWGLHENPFSNGRENRGSSVSLTQAEVFFLLEKRCPWWFARSTQFSGLACFSLSSGLSSILSLFSSLSFHSSLSLRGRHHTCSWLVHLTLYLLVYLCFPFASHKFCPKKPMTPANE